MAHYVNNEVIDLAGVPPTDLEEHTHPFGANTFAAKNVVLPLPSAFLSIMNVDYASRTDGQPVYVGYNVRGAANSATTWVIQQVTYNADGNVTQKRIAIDSWDNRASATYS